MRAVENWLISRLTTVTAISMMFMGSRSWPTVIHHTDGGCSRAISLGPCCANLFDASPALRPSTASLPIAATTCSAAKACQDGGAAIVRNPTRGRCRDEKSTRLRDGSHSVVIVHHVVAAGGFDVATRLLPCRKPHLCRIRFLVGNVFEDVPDDVQPRGFLSSE